MRISKVKIENFRNFHRCEFELARDVVVVGENKCGKSNFLHALRILLDPRLADFDRRLRIDDVWDGTPRPLTRNDSVLIEVEISEFDNDPNALALLGDYLIQAEPMIARLSYRWRPIPTLTHDPRHEDDYEFVCYGGASEEYSFGFDLRRQIPLTVLPALRDAEADLANWRKSPLAPLLKVAASTADTETLEQITESVAAATNQIAEIEGIRGLATDITTRFQSMAGTRHAVDTSLGFAHTHADRLVRSLRLFIDNGNRPVSDASLGCANLIYLTLLMLDFERQVAEGSRNHTVLAIEEPEAHLHPHLQRLVFGDFFEEPSENQNIWVTTHSPNIVSVAPIRSIVVMKGTATEGTKVSSAANLELSIPDYEDLQRYVDVNRGELVFSPGVILVEGIAEEYLIPQFAKLLDINLDKLGISVCSVEGTNFAPYVKLFSANCLDIPFCVITDMDPVAAGGSLGIPRARKLLEIINQPVTVNLADADVPTIAAANGVFLNASTLEIDLLASGATESMLDALKEVTTNGAAIDRCEAWGQDLTTVDVEQLLKDIVQVGKGRFAQRLASKIQIGECPRYIQNSLEFMTEAIR